MMPSISISARQDRILRWWAKRRGKTRAQAMDEVFAALFLVVEPTYEVETGDRRPKRNAEAQTSPSNGKPKVRGAPAPSRTRPR